MIVAFITRLSHLVAVFTVIACLSFTLQGSRTPTLIEQIQESGTLVVASRNGPTTFYEYEQAYSGFEYVMAAAFAEYLGVELEIREIDGLDQLLNAAVSRDIHIAAAGLTVTPRRLEKVAFSTPYMKVTQQLIYHANSSRPKSIEDVIGKQIVVIANSSHAERLRELKKQHPDLTWEERYGVEMLDLLELVHTKQVDYVVVDSNSVEMNMGLYPKAKSAFALSEPENLAWALTKTPDHSLLAATNAFLSQFKESGKLADIKQSFYGHLGHIEYSDALVFTKRLKTRLPKWEGALKQAGEMYGVDWQLLAALSYQESHWNPKAKSPTGVRGFMMLTLSTAKEMKIKNRLSAMQSIDGGTRYFKKLYNRLSENLNVKDRTWFALAAYNVGFGHLQDARALAQQHGDDPDKWSDVKDYLPLLAKRQYYKTTRHGYARGWEAVSYVENIRNFHNIIAWQEAEKEELTKLALQEEPEENIIFNSSVGNALAETIQTQSL